MQQNIDPEKLVKDLEKEYTLVAKPRVRLVYFYIILAILLGAAMAIMYVASRTPSVSY